MKTRRAPAVARWSVDETYVKIAGEWASVYRASDERGRVVDVDVREQRASADAAACFRRAIEATGTFPDEVTTDRAASPPALADVLPAALHEVGKQIQQRIERDHQHLEGRLAGTRGFKTLRGARVLCAGHALLRNLRGGFYHRAQRPVAAQAWPASPVCRIWDALTAELAGR